MTSFLYTAEDTPEVVRAVIFIESAANSIFLVSSLCYLFSWLVTDKLSRGCKLANVEMWANLFNVLPSSLYIFSSLGTAWFHFTALPVPADARRLSLAVVAPSFDIVGRAMSTGGTASSSSELRLLSGVNVFADALNVLGALFYFAAYYRDARSVARECAAADDAVAAAERAAETVGLVSASALSAASPASGGRDFIAEFEKSMRELQLKTSGAALHLEVLPAGATAEDSAPHIVSAHVSTDETATLNAAKSDDYCSCLSATVAAAAGSAIDAAITGGAGLVGDGHDAAARHHAHHLHPLLPEHRIRVAACVQSGAGTHTHVLSHTRPHARHFHQPLRRRLSEELQKGISAALTDAAAGVLQALLSTGAEGSSEMAATTTVSTGFRPIERQVAQVAMPSMSEAPFFSTTDEAVSSSRSFAASASSTGGGSGCVVGMSWPYSPRAIADDHGEVLRVPVKLMRVRNAIFERTRTRFVQVLGASLAASRGGGASATQEVLRSRSLLGAHDLSTAASRLHALALHPRQQSHWNLRVHGLIGHNLCHKSHANTSACPIGRDRSSINAVDEAASLLQAVSLGNAAGEAAQVGSCAGGCSAVADEKRRGSASGIDSPLRIGSQQAVSKAPVAHHDSDSYDLPLLAACKMTPSADSTPVERDVVGVATDAGTEASLGRVQVHGYLGYFNSLDEFDGYQPCGCLYPLLRRAAPAYWQFVTAR